MNQSAPIVRVCKCGATFTPDRDRSWYCFTCRADYRKRFNVVKKREFGAVRTLADWYRPKGDAQ